MLILSKTVVESLGLRFQSPIPIGARETDFLYFLRKQHGHNFDHYRSLWRTCTQNRGLQNMLLDIMESKARPCGIGGLGCRLRRVEANAVGRSGNSRKCKVSVEVGLKSHTS